MTFVKTEEQNNKVFFSSKPAVCRTKLTPLKKKMGSGQSSQVWQTELGQRLQMSDRCAIKLFSYLRSLSAPSTGTWTSGIGMLARFLPSCHQRREMINRKVLIRKETEKVVSLTTIPAHRPTT